MNAEIYTALMGKRKVSLNKWRDTIYGHGVRGLSGLPLPKSMDRFGTIPLKIPAGFSFRNGQVGSKIQETQKDHEGFVEEEQRSRVNST